MPQTLATPAPQLHRAEPSTPPQPRRFTASQPPPTATGASPRLQGFPRARSHRPWSTPAPGLRLTSAEGELGPPVHLLTAGELHASLIPCSASQRDHAWTSGDPEPGEALLRPLPERHPRPAARPRPRPPGAPLLLDSSLGEQHPILLSLLHQLARHVGHPGGRNSHTGAPPPCSPQPHRGGRSAGHPSPA